MSSRSRAAGSPGAARARRRGVRAGVWMAMLALPFGTGCWEQWAPNWWPQMKDQPAVQAFEETGLLDKPVLRSPEGAVPVGGGEPLVGRMDIAAAGELENPFPRDDLRSLENGRVQYQTYCEVCHGPEGRAQGPVARIFPGVFPLVGLTTGRSDGFIYNVIRQGGGGVPGLRMPAYSRIPPDDRWDIVNYVRYLDRRAQQAQQGGTP